MFEEEVAQERICENEIHLTIIIDSEVDVSTNFSNVIKREYPANQVNDKLACVI